MCPLQLSLEVSNFRLLLAKLLLECFLLLLVVVNIFLQQLTLPDCLLILPLKTLASLVLPGYHLLVLVQLVHLPEQLVVELPHLSLKHSHDLGLLRLLSLGLLL